MRLALRAILDLALVLAVIGMTVAGLRVAAAIESYVKRECAQLGEVAK
jgi:hypothetical protein